MADPDSRVWVNPETGGVESTREWQRRLNAGDPEAHRQLADLAQDPTGRGAPTGEAESGGGHSDPSPGAGSLAPVFYLGGDIQWALLNGDQLVVQFQSTEDRNLALNLLSDWIKVSLTEARPTTNQLIFQIKPGPPDSGAFGDHRRNSAR